MLCQSTVVSATTTSSLGNTSVRNEKTDDGTVVGAVRTANIYAEPSREAIAYGTVIKNQLIRVLESENGFYRIRYGEDGFAYVKCEDFVGGDDLLQFILDNSGWYTKTVEITVEHANVYTWLSVDSVFCVADKGDVYQWVADYGDHVIARLDYVDADGNESPKLVQISKEDAKVKYSLKVTSFKDATMESAEQARLIELACSFVGNAYVWGGSNPNTGADCSGFVQYCYKQIGIDLPRCSYEQALVGRPVSLDELQPGDLIFYRRGSEIGHVTMYMGDGMCVQARGRAYGICITRYDYSTPDHAMRVLE